MVQKEPESDSEYEVEFELLWAKFEDGSLHPAEECMHCLAVIMYQGQAHRCSDFPEDNRDTTEIDEFREAVVQLFQRYE
jgi:hypothetical protein